MFKSVFSKYVSAFMIIILLSFTAVLVITTSAIGRYSGGAKQELMQAAADASGEYLEGALAQTEASFESLLSENTAEIENTLGLVLVNGEDIMLVLCDANGKPLMFVGGNTSKINTAAGVPDAAMQALVKGDDYSSFGHAEGMFDEMQALYAEPVKDSQGNFCGAVFVCSESVMMIDLWEMILRVVMGSILWVLLAALIAVYFISERVVAPLREISIAAKKFASGHFDVRVAVRGSDEVAEVARAFNNMAESLDNYDTMRNTFMSDVSHDLRSPMTSISGFIDGILDGVIPPEQHKYYLQVVSSEIKRLSRLVSSLLDLSRIQAGDRKFNMTDFDICETARQILISFEQKITAKNLDVEIDFQEERMIANADRDAIYQVLYNLCDNAVKFASDGGKFKIKISRIKRKKLLLEVYNDGQGIAEADINYVFERFYKSDKSRGLNKNGAGLGLFISKTIMDAHDEKIWVESEYGKNCCFSFTLSGE